MSRIILNKLQILILQLHKEGHISKEDTSLQIVNMVFAGASKKWTRILNNTDQPTLEQAYGIAQILGKSIEDLFVFSKTTSKAS